MILALYFFFSSRRRHTRSLRDWSSDVCSSDLVDRLRQRGLVDEHRLEAALQRGVLLDVLAILVQRRRADALDLAARERGLEDRSEERRVGKECTARRLQAQPNEHM